MDQFGAHFYPHLDDASLHLLGEMTNSNHHKTFTIERLAFFLKKKKKL